LNKSIAGFLGGFPLTLSRHSLDSWLQLVGAMIIELLYVGFVTIFIGLLVLGHALLFSATYRGFIDDWGIGRHAGRKPPL
jgi:hypothetical protein